MAIAAPTWRRAPNVIKLRVIYLIINYLCLILRLFFVYCTSNQIVVIMQKNLCSYLQEDQGRDLQCLLEE